MAETTVETLVRLIAKIVKREAEAKAKQGRQRERMLDQQMTIAKDDSLKADTVTVEV